MFEQSVLTRVLEICFLISWKSSPFTRVTKAELRLDAFVFYRLLLAYVMIPIMQREVNTFVDVVWNCHRIREQRDTFLPDGVPNHIYSFPDKYGLEDCGRYLCNFFSRGSTFHQCQDSK